MMMDSYIDTGPRRLTLSPEGSVRQNEHDYCKCRTEVTVMEWSIDDICVRRCVSLFKSIL